VSRTPAFSVHILTALGAAIGLLALIEAVNDRWVWMFAWLGVALVIDGIDGPLARYFKVAERLPDWSGDTLDLVVDFITYVFVPAFALAESGLLWAPSSLPLAGAVIVSGAMYFSDTRMKEADNYFRGFPTLWNAAVLYLFVLQPPPLVASVLIAALVVLTFVPIRVLHPVRVTRFRGFNLFVTGLWLALALWAIAANFDLPVPAQAAFCAIGLYFLFGDLALRVARLSP
jgi:phosphatidylcholine synthase